MVLVMKGPKTRVNATYRILQQICVICIILSMHHFILSTLAVLVLICVHTESEIHDLKEDIAFMGPY